MLDRLAASRARQRAFVADAAHELRSPLASMQTQLDVNQHVDGPSWQMQELEAEVRRMTRLVDDLLVLARLDADARPSATPDLVDVAAVVREVTRAPARRVPVTTTLTGGARLLVRGRHDDLRRALGNLVDNAVRHARTTGLGHGSRGRSPRRGRGVGRRCGDPRARTANGSSSGSRASTKDAHGTPAAAGSGWPSPARWSCAHGGDVELDDSESGGLTARLLLRRGDAR